MPRRPMARILRGTVSRSIKTPIVLRLWGIKAAKLRYSLRFGAYEEMVKNHFKKFRYAKN